MVLIGGEVDNNKWLFDYSCDAIKPMLKKNIIEYIEKL